MPREAKAEWRRVVKSLPDGIITESNRGTLTCLCNAWSQHVQAQKELAGPRGGLLDETTNGNTIQNTLVGISNKSAEMYVKFAAEFGMTPSARTRVAGAAVPSRPDDPFEVFLGGGA